MQTGCTKLECLVKALVAVEDEDDEEDEDVFREHDDTVRDIVEVFF